MINSTTTLELKTTDEGCMVQQDAEVVLLVNGEPNLRVKAYIDRAQGADGGWYRVIKFRPVEAVKPEPLTGFCGVCRTTHLLTANRCPAMGHIA